jgi:hypothetical protein
MIIYKIGIVLLCWFIEFLLIKAAVWGSRSRGNAYARKIHMGFAKRAILLMSISVVVIEVFVRLNGGLHAKYLLMTHIPLSGISLVTGIALLRINGERFPKPHRIMGYVCLGSYSLALILGMILLKNA